MGARRMKDTLSFEYVSDENRVDRLILPSLYSLLEVQRVEENVCWTRKGRKRERRRENITSTTEVRSEEDMRSRRE